MRLDLTFRLGRPSLPAPLRAIALAGLLLLALAAAGPAAEARSMTPEERTALGTTVTDFNAAIAKLEYKTIVEVLPSCLIDMMVAQSGASADDMRKMLIEVMQQAMSSAKIEVFTLDLAKAEERALPSGDPYVLIPTLTVVVLGEKRVEERSQTLGMLNNGKWSLARLNDAQQMTVVKTACPAFAGETFPPGEQVVK